MEQTYFRKGLGLKDVVAGELTADYHSRLVEEIRAQDGSLTVGDLTFRLAKEFGFCYGVDRAVEYAYQARAKFPDRRIFLVGEIIHNPHVNTKLEAMGVTILQTGEPGEFDFSDIGADDVVVIPAFGARLADFQLLRDIGCLLIDTTCGSVLNVWKRVERYAREGFTAVVHGKHYHEETKATVSQVSKHAGAKYLIVRDMDEAEILCRYLRTADNLAEITDTFAHKVSDQFDFDLDLERIGVANQTTMLANESLAIAHEIGKALADRYGQERLDEHFRTFDTICSATQERQDAVLELIEEPLDAMIVVGGYNSSNTNHLAKICSQKVTSYHIADATCIDPDTETISYKPVEGEAEAVRAGWLGGLRRIGITAGASTPDNKIGESIERILRTKGVGGPY